MAVVLIALDASKASRYCLEYYLKYLHKEGNHVHSIYVADYWGDIGVMEGPSPGRIRELEEQDSKKAAAIEADVNKVLKQCQIEGQFTRQRAKDPWQKIVEYAKSVQATMIVMGSRGLGKLRRTVLGSVSEGVLHHSDIPVVICKVPKDREGHA